jgi:alpha-tubulin suppressor-like RCC1 family protein
MGDALPFVDVGNSKSATAIAAGGYHTCAILTGGALKCWGENRDVCALGIGEGGDRGDEAGEMGDALPKVDLGTGRSAKAVAAGVGYTCAILDNDAVKCWGHSQSGQAGLGTNLSLGRGCRESEMGNGLPTVALGTDRTAMAIAARDATCASLDDGTLKCWGYNAFGQLGLGDTNNRGDAPGEMGDSLPTVALGK